MGSSPRMRGTRCSGVRRGCRQWLIPTYAGNTCRPARVSLSRRAHPHVCGEHQSPGGRTLSNGGSSPRMRGTQNTERYAPIHGGLIPTYAGNTSNVPCAVRRGRAHPHVCGEHRQRYFYPASIGGSSPRMRGTPDFSFSWLRTLGLIPTYAGNTPSTHPRLKQAWAHPHVCGEHSRPPSL